jgi:1,4-alpha-glucan branching enzyme
MQHLDANDHVLTDPFIERLYVHEDDKLIVYRRGPLVFVFNFHPTRSYSDLRIPVPDPKNYRPILNSDDTKFGGYGLVDPNVTYFKQDVPYADRKQSVQIYIPTRSAQVLAPV